MEATFGKENYSKPFLRESMMTSFNHSNDAVLVCAKFQEGLTLELGESIVGKLKTKTFSLHNPNSSKPVTINVQKNEKNNNNNKSSVTIELGHDCQSQVVIAPGATVPGLVYWIPSEPGNIREIITLRMDDKASLQIKVLGTSAPEKTVPMIAKTPAVTFGSHDEDFMTLGSSTTRKSLLAMKSNKLISANGRKSLIPTISKASGHGAISASANVPITTDNSEQWMNQQVKTLTNWMNQKFRKASALLDSSIPAAASNKNGTLPEDEDGDNMSVNMSICNESITNDYIHNLQLLFEKDEKEKLFLFGRKLFLSTELQTMLQVIYKEIDNNRLTIRDDRNLHLDIGLQESILELLFCYQEDWLKFGLEIVFNRVIPLPSSSKHGQQDTNQIELPKLRRVLRTFIQQNLLSYEITTDMMKMGLAHREVEKMKKTMVCNHIFKRFFELILFLDQARQQTLLPNRMLFQKKGTTTASKELLIQFCQFVLKGEGDIIKHLTSIGYTVSFQQKYIDEYSYLIDVKQENLFQACKDGVRLARLYEILANQQQSSNAAGATSKSVEIMNDLRVPAGSFLQKKFNVSLVLTKAFGKNHGFDIDGMIEGNTLQHKQTLLMILWKFMYGFDLNILVTPQMVLKEILRVQNQSPMTDSVVGTGADSVSSSLLIWCQTVANQYFTSIDQRILSLNSYELLQSDGRILCLLIHYYHPYLFPKHFLATILSSNQDETTQKKKLLRYFFHACKNLGGIPSIFYQFSSNSELIKYHYSYTHDSTIPSQLQAAASDQKKEEEKTTILFLSYLFLRLVDSSKQMKAVLRIQRAYRRYKQIKYSRKRATTARVSFKMTSASLSKSESDDGETKNREKSVSSVSKFSTNLKGTFSPEITVLAPKNARFVEKTSEKKSEESQNLLVESFDALDLSHLIVESIESIDSYHYHGHGNNFNETLNQSISFDLNESGAPLQDLLTTTYQPVASKLNFDKPATISPVKEAETEVEELDDFDVNMLLQVESEAKIKAEEEARQIAQLQQQEEEQKRLAQEKAEAEELEREKERLEFERQVQYQLEQERQAQQEKERQQRQQRQQTAAATRIQSLFRRFHHRRQFLLKRLVVLIFQSSWRRKLMIRHLQKMRFALVKIIQFYRAWKDYKRYLQWKTPLIAAVTHIQKIYRGYRSHHAYKQYQQQQLQQKQDAIAFALKLNQFQRKVAHRKIVRNWKSYQTIKVQKRNTKQEEEWRKQVNAFYHRHAKKTIYSFVWKSFSQIKFKKAQFLAAKRVQKTVRTFLMNRRFKHFLHGLRTFVALRRGYLIRKVFYTKQATKDQKKLLTILQTLRNNHHPSNEDANLSMMSTTEVLSNQKGLTLHAKAQHALNLLHNGKMISHYMKSCQYLLTYTSYSKEICELFVYTNSSTILFNLLLTCNRSTPHQELLKLILLTLLNITKYKHLTTTVSLIPNAAEILIDLMQMFRDKNIIFLLSTKLLTLLLQSNTMIKEACNQPVYRKRLEGIYHIIERKTRIESRVQHLSELPHASRHMHSAEHEEFLRHQINPNDLKQAIESIQQVMRLIKL